MQKTTWQFVIFYLVIATFAYYVQTRFVFSPDVGYLLHATNVMLAGGKYGSDILETNPPLILFLYTPACLVAKWTSLNLILTLRLYVLTLAFLSSTLCLQLLNQLIKPRDKFLRYFMLCMLLFVYFFTPLYEIGQREHLLIILMMPYLFTVAAKLENKKIPTYKAILIGCMAGLGFGLKPFFLCTLMLVELYAMWKKRSIFAWLRPETLTILAVFGLYLAAIVIYQPSYFSIMLPLVMHFYFSGATEAWSILFARMTVIMSLAAIVSYLFFYRHDNYQTFNTVIWLALIGMTTAFIIPKAAWFYHTLPAVGLAYLLTANYLGQFISAYNAAHSANLKNYFQQAMIFLLLLILIYAIPLYDCYQSYTTNIIKSKWLATMTQMTDFFNAQPGKQSIYCFSTAGSDDCFPLLYTTQSEYGGRYPFFWWFFAMRNNKISSPVLINEKKYLLTSVSEDLDRYQPKWIIINTEFNHWQQLHAMLTAEDAHFQQAWQHYHYSRAFGYYQIYSRDA